MGRWFRQEEVGMNTLRRFAAKDFSVPADTSWYLAGLGEFRGKEALYTQQSPIPTGFGWEELIGLDGDDDPEACCRNMLVMSPSVP